MNKGAFALRLPPLREALESDVVGKALTSTPPQPLAAVFAQVVSPNTAQCRRTPEWKLPEIKRLSRKYLDLLNFRFHALIGS